MDHILHIECPVDLENLTDIRNISHSLDYSLKNIDKVVTASVLFLTVLPFVLFKFKFFPIGTTSAVLIGALTMVLGQVITQDGVYSVLGHKRNLQTICLLIGMMILFQYLDREKLVHKLLIYVLKKDISFENYLWRISLMSFFLAALFTNDACCVIITPILINHWTNQKRSPSELETLILAIPTSANIGSVTTIFGNPQMALIAAYTNGPLYKASYFDLRRCIMSLGVPAIIGCLLNLCFLILYFHINKNYNTYYKKTTFKISRKNQKSIAITTIYENKSIHTDLTNSNDKQVSIIKNCFQSHEFKELDHGSALQNDINSIHNILTEISIEQETDKNSKFDDDFVQSRFLLFKAFLCMIIVLVIVLYFISSQNTEFDIGLVPIGGSIIVILVDTIVNRRNPATIIKRVDWGVILMFFGIFVWMAALNSTNLPRWLWKEMGLVNLSSKDTLAIMKLTFFVLIGSNVFSNVPLTLIVLEQIPPCQNFFHLVVYLAWVATIAGNLTLFGSVANLIVSEKSWEANRFKLSFWVYLKYGFISTIIICSIGVYIITLLLNAIHF